MEKKNQQTRQVADFLAENEQSILDEWRDLMEQKTEKSAVLSKKSRDAFHNSIPLFLDQLNNALKNGHPTILNVGKFHGINRWKYGYSLKELINEWRILQEVLMNKIYHSFDPRTEPEMINKAQQTLAKSFQKSISGSIIKYNEQKEKEAATRMKDLKEALNKSKTKTTSVEDLRGTSHDLKGAVFNLKMGFHLLQKRKLDGKSSEIIKQMEEGSNNVERLINDLLDLFRFETGQEKLNIEEFEIFNVLMSFCKSMEPTAKAENLELKYNGEKNLIIHSDKKKIQRIVQNLILNSLKYTKSGFVEINWKRKSENFWMLKIRDTGPGLSNTHASSLTTKANASSAKQIKSVVSTEKVEEHGEGIGLLIVKRLCQLLDAVIEIETEKGKGTSYEITFPLKVRS